MPIGFARELPYRLHTNRELGLMLEGIKPLAVFADGRDHFPDCVARYLRLFDRHVRNGRIVRHDRFVPIDHPVIDAIHYIYFTLPGEEWRVDAMIGLMAEPDVWSADKERRQGELLGYTDEQNDVWLNRISVQKRLASYANP